MHVYLVVEFELATQKEKNIAVFESEYLARKFIERLGKNGDYYEYGINKLLVYNQDTYVWLEEEYSVIN